MKNPQFATAEAKVADICKKHDADKVLVLTDSNVSPMIEELLATAPRYVIAAGESSKTLEGATEVWRFLERQGALRRSIVVNVGGGMVSDLGGFAAATFKRGIGYINLPTTLLASVDASIGGKTGINFASLKNEIGAFALPLEVYPLTTLFWSLPEEEWLSGVGEAIKTALLDSKELYELVVSEDFIVKRDPEVVAKVVERCAGFKEDIVKRDYRETRLRRILNLGHTVGHAIEAWKLANGEYIPHGIAVAHGLRFALEKSCREAGLAREVAESYAEVLEKYFPPLIINEEDMAQIEYFMSRDKKNREAGKPAWILLRAIGEPVLD